MRGLRRVLRWLRIRLIDRPGPDRIGLVAEFGGPEELLDAVRALRAGGHDALDAYVPYPVEGLEDALELERPRLPWLIGLFGFGAAALTYLLLWWINVVDFPRNVGGRPLHSAPSFVPVVFEIGVLAGGLTAFAALFLAGGMPRVWHPLLEVEGFESASVDGYWLGVGRGDARYDADALRSDLLELGARRVEPVGEAS